MPKWTAADLKRFGFVTGDAWVNPDMDIEIEFDGLKPVRATLFPRRYEVVISTGDDGITHEIRSEWSEEQDAIVVRSRVVDP